MHLHITKVKRKESKTRETGRQKKRERQADELSDRGQDTKIVRFSLQILIFQVISIHVRLIFYILKIVSKFNAGIFQIQMEVGTSMIEIIKREVHGLFCGDPQTSFQNASSTVLEIIFF